MSCWIFAACGLAALFFIFLLQAALPVRSRFAWMAESDSDMKLAPFPGTKASAKDALEPSAEEIELYFKHKRCHNLDRARQLGTKLGEGILSFCSGFGGIFLSDKELFHARMLYLFVTEDCVRHFVPDLILSKLILSQINDTISVQRPHFYNNLVQYRAYTVYKMCLEEEQDSLLEQKASRIGCCWAQMAGDKENDALCQTGKRLYLLMKERCEEQLLGVSFQTV